MTVPEAVICENSYRRLLYRASLSGVLKLWLTKSYRALTETIVVISRQISATTLVLIKVLLGHVTHNLMLEDWVGESAAELVLP